jgi:hypothetical protein
MKSVGFSHSLFVAILNWEKSYCLHHNPILKTIEFKICSQSFKTLTDSSVSDIFVAIFEV